MVRGKFLALRLLNNNVEGRLQGGPTSMAERSSKGSGVYLYGIIQDNQARRWNLPGIGGSEVVYTVCQEALAAIVSDGDIEIYETTQENLQTNNKVQEEVKKQFWVLP